MIEIRQYVDRQGRAPFLKWLNALSDEAQARVSASLERLELGNLSAIKSVGAGVQEIRVHFGPGYRIYFGWDGARLVILLAGGIKNGQQNDIARAKKIWAEFKQRKLEGSWC